ncbi:MAG: deoxyribonuclease IV [Thermodesulfovibrionia bacterium]|nr:deoxyribonuclease IV [Thermodesulfovibrionia bacterium]
MNISGNENKFRIGLHTSIAGGASMSVERAAALNCTTMQIFTHNPRQWRQSPISGEEAERFAYLRQKHDINPVFSHASYLINLASRSNTVLRKSVELLAYELMNADRLGIEYVVLHTGSASGEDARKARTRAVKSILKSVGTGHFSAALILENTAGEKGDITSSIQTLSEIMDRCSCENIAGICIDTCHAFSSGYDLISANGIENLMQEINEYAGLDKLKLIHLNDSKKPLGSGVDRHEHIGKGFIGMKGFENILSDRRILNVPIILETPKENEADDKNNLREVFNILSRISHKRGQPRKPDK